MEVRLVDAAGLSSSRGLEQKHRVQDVFSAVLAAVGREGYASAEPVEEDQPLGEQLQSAWSDWFDAELRGRYATEQPGEQQRLKQGYNEILTRAYDEGGYVSPKDFLRGLSSDELEVVQHVHRLAARIDVDSLSEEGALNLVLPPAAQVDLNHDGLTQSGAGYGVRFPDSNTPADVAAAWDEATAGLSLREKMTYELQMVLPILLANIHTDDTGAFSHRVEPGEPGYVNPLADADYSYAEAIQDQLDGLEFAFSRGHVSKEAYDRRHAFWSTFQRTLDEHQRGASGERAG